MLATVKYVRLYGSITSVGENMTLPGMQKQEEANIRRKEKFVVIIAGTATLLCALVLFMTEKKSVLVLAMMSGIVVSILVIFLQHKLSKCNRLRVYQNMLRHEINGLEKENLQLQNSCYQLQMEADKLSCTQQKLEKTLSRGGMVLDEFIQIVKQNEILSYKMKVNSFH